MSGQSGDLGAAIAAWAAGNSAVEALVLFGSRQRQERRRLDAVDLQSDWDFHVITRKPRALLSSGWTRELPGATLRAYAIRTAAIGRVPRVGAVFDEGDVDLVVIPTAIGRKVRWATRLGLHRRPGLVRKSLQDIAEIVRPGWKFLKDTGGWGRFYQLAVDSVPDPWLDDAALVQLAEGMVCDYVWIRRKLVRGELLAAQRVLYQEVWEANLKLLHELRHRRGLPTFTKARRLERLAGARRAEGDDAGGGRDRGVAADGAGARGGEMPDADAGPGGRRVALAGAAGVRGLTGPLSGPRSGSLRRRRW